MASYSLARRLAAGETVYTGWCTLASPLVVETLAREGFAAVTIDQQHGLWDTAATVAGIAAIHHGGAAPVVRVPFGQMPIVSRVLDFGAEGVIMPLVSTPAEARAFVAAAKFPPLGERSWGPHRAMTLGGVSDAGAHLRDANRETVTIAMIETRAALDNLDAIAGTAGIDAIFVGPYDLSVALSGGAALDPLSAEVERALDRIVAAAQQAGKVAGAYCPDAGRAAALATRGFRFLAVASDLLMLRAGAAAEMRALKTAK
jgi:4-hydroxy-2-oxoheptanedioate aldolase